jgi:cytochrome c peroxidase
MSVLAVGRAGVIGKFILTPIGEHAMTKRNSPPWILLVAMTAVLLAFCMTRFASAQVPLGPHGAAVEAHQQRILDTLRAEKGTKNYVPNGIDPIYWNALIPKDNEITPARIALGRKLYFEPKLSADGTVSCATCHDVTRGFSDQQPTSEGIGGQFGTRNSPTVMNVTLLHTMFWDGRSPTVDHQAMQPIINPVEMGMEDNEAVIIAGIKDDHEYQKMFREAYNRDVNYQDIGRAIAAFERTLNFLDSPFRQYMNGDANAISADAVEGWKLFNREGRCTACHTMSPSNPLGTDNKFHNIGIGVSGRDFQKMAAEARAILLQDGSDKKLDELALASEFGELGRFTVTHNPHEIGAFRTPMLLNVGITGPYMHDGSLKTLWDVLDHYNAGGEPNLFLDGGIEPLNLTNRQIDQIVAFLFTLTDVRFAKENTRHYQEQLTASRRERPERNTPVAERKVLSFENFQSPQTRKEN